MHQRVHEKPPPGVQPTSRVLTPADFNPPAEQVAMFDFFKGDSASPIERVPRRRLPAAEYGADFALSEGDRRIEYLSVADDGSLLLHASLERDDGSVALFDPPLPVCPSRLPAGQPFASESAMRVVSDANPDRQREKGRATRTITHIGTERVTVPAGTYDAHRVEITFLADLAFADADTLTTQWIVPGVGVVREERSRRVTVLGVQGNPTVQRLELAALQ